jgi:hypothetical protein
MNSAAFVAETITFPSLLVPLNQREEVVTCAWTLTVGQLKHHSLCLTIFTNLDIKIAESQFFALDQCLIPIFSHRFVCVERVWISIPKGFTSPC